MTEDQRHDPEYFLELVKRADARSKGGKLKIFFGMAAGVGKTYAMLQATQQYIKDGGDAVLGVVETHGRKETAALLENIPIIPLKFIHYKDSIFEEMDLDAILRRNPSLVIVDELAHSNIPGTRHSKRWQDVMEILDAGIDVYTTLNVQHIDSLKQVVEQITGLKIRETVPDIIFERATEIAMVDLTPIELLKRLKEGKVYLGSHPNLAAEHFFKEDRITALREIALRYVAERVDHDLKGLIPTMGSTESYRLSERLMVAVNHSPHSEYLIRAARRLAYTMRIPWFAVHIDNGMYLSAESQRMLAKNLALARDLGAEVMMTTHPDLKVAFKKIIHQFQITQVVIGRPSEWGLKDIWVGGTILDHISRENREVDIYVVRQQMKMEPEPPQPGFWRTYFKFPTKFTYYWAVLLLISVLTAVNFVMLPILGWKSSGFIYLLGILTLSLFTGKGPILFAAILSALALNIFFIPPHDLSLDNFKLEHAQDFFFFIVYIFTAIITGTLVTRVKHRENMLMEREEYTQTLYHIEHEIASAPHPQRLFEVVAQHLDSTFDGNVGFALRKKAEGWDLQVAQFFRMDNKEMAVAMWSMKNNKPAGWSTDTLPSFETLFIPLKGIKRVVGVMAFRPKSQLPLLPDQMNLLSTICQRLASFLERYLSEKDQQKSQYLEQVEILHQNIINIISEQFGEPLQKILNSLKNMEECRIKQEIQDSVEKLQYIVNNFKYMSKIRSNMLSIKKIRFKLSEFLEQILIKLKRYKIHHKVVMEIPKDIPDLYFDYDLMEIAISQILMNALTYSPPGTKIEITSAQQNDKVVLSILDQGPGIPSEDLDKIFEKFYRIPGTNLPGSGLGLPLAKTIIELHDGTIEAFNRPEGGAEIRMTFKTC